VGLEPGKLNNLQADNAPYLHEAEPTHEFPEDAPDIHTMSPIDTPVQLPNVIASQYPNAAQVQVHDVEEYEDAIGDMPANLEEWIDNKGSEINDNSITQHDAEGVQINTIQAVSPQTHSITRSGSAVKYRSDMFQNFTLLQQTNKNHIPSSHNPGYAHKEKYLVHEAMTSYAFTQYSLHQGLWKYPFEAKIAAMAEMKQLHDMNVFKPVKKDDLTSQELSHVLSSLMFIKQKRCGWSKARACADRRTQRLLYNKMDASLPTVKTESVILTSIIDEDQSRFVGVYDIPGALLHSKQDKVVHVDN
jgi:hypothetical protein